MLLAAEAFIQSPFVRVWTSHERPSWAEPVYVQDKVWDPKLEKWSFNFPVLWRGKVYRRKQSSFQAPEHHIHQSPTTLAIVIARVNLLQTTYQGADINITVVCFWTLSCGTFSLDWCVFLSFFKGSHAVFVEICDWKQGHLFPEDCSMAIQACSVNFYFSWRKIMKVQSGFLFLGLTIPWLICGLCWWCIIEYNVLK